MRVPNRTNPLRDGTIASGLWLAHIYLLRGKLMNLKLTKVFQKVPEGYIGFVQELPGANTQGETLEEARANLEEAIALVLEANRTLAEELIQGQDVIREPVLLSAA